MNTKALIEKFYQETPLEKIPWNKTQAEFFIELLNSAKLGSGKALDLGCGVGTKSVLLARKGFKVTGVDIAPTAIRHAEEKTKKEKLHIKFFVANASDLSFLGDEKFDLVLDWANLHGIPKTKRRRYIREIAKHCKKGGRLLLRCWSKKGLSRITLGFLTPMGPVHLFSKKEIEELFSEYFKVLLTHKSKPFNFPGERSPAEWLDEYLMERL